MTAPLLSLTGLSKRFGRVTVADDLSLDVAPGELLGVVGPNGAGKSTLFAMVAGDLRPDAGRVHFDGQDVTRLTTAARCRSGIVRTYQVPRPFPYMSVFENVLVAAQQGGHQRGQGAYRTALAVLGDVGLRDVANEPAGRLTLMRRKRLELAKALATGPRLLLLDEVAGGLTEPEVDELVAIVTRLRGAGLTVVWIEHVVRALVGTVDRLVCLASGRFIGDGPPAGVLASAAVREAYLGADTEFTSVAGTGDTGQGGDAGQGGGAAP